MYRMTVSSMTGIDNLYKNLWPELNVFQVNDNAEMGMGLFLSSFYNMVKVGSGFVLNGEKSGSFYWSIGLNFIEGYNKIGEMLANTK